MKNPFYNKNIIVVSHDAGGAEVLSSYLKYNEPGYGACILDGPAVDIFRKKLSFEKKFCFFSLKNPLLQTFDCIITATSWQSSLEKKSLKFFKSHGLYSISMLDHWSNYDARFVYENTTIYPDEIWVLDEYALMLSKKLFPALKIRQKINYYLNDVVRLVKSFEDSLEKINILYVSQPFSELLRSIKSEFILNEQDMFKKYLDHLISTNQWKEEISIRIRSHPGEEKGKYAGIINNYKNVFDIQESFGFSLVEDIARAQKVVGGDSMAMIVALFSKKQVFSIFPKGKIQSSLPYDQISYIFKEEK